MTPGPAVNNQAPAPEIAFVPDDTTAAPAPVVEHVSVTPVSQVNRDTRCLVNPQFSTARVEVILQELPEVRVIERTREHIAFFVGQIHQEQIVVPIPQIVQKISQKRLLLERIRSHFSSGTQSAARCGADCRRSCATGCRSSSRRCRW